MPASAKPKTPKGKSKGGKKKDEVVEEAVEEVQEEVVEEVVDEEPVIPGQEHSLAFKSLSDRDIRELRECPDSETTIRLLSKKVKYPNYERNVRDCIMLEFLYFNFVLAEENSFNRTKTSTLFSIMHEIATLAQNGAEMSEVYAEFKRLMLAHSFQNTKEGMCKLFTLNDVKVITDFATTTFFQHFKLYRHVFNHEQEQIRSETEVFLQTALPPRPLEEYLTQEEWDAKCGQAEEAAAEQERFAAEAAQKIDAEIAERENALMAKADAESKAAGLIADAAKGDTDAQVQLVLQTVLERQVAEMRSTMELKLAKQEADLDARLHAASSPVEGKSANKGKDKGRPKSRGGK